MTLKESLKRSKYFANKTMFCSIYFILVSHEKLLSPDGTQSIQSALHPTVFLLWYYSMPLLYGEKIFLVVDCTRYIVVCSKNIRKRLFCTLAQHTIYLSPVVVCNTTCQKIPRSGGKWKVPNASYLLHFATFTQKLFSVSQHILELI